MQKIKHELDDVLSALSADAPSFDRDQLRAIISRPSTADIQMKSFNKKGLFIMSTSILLVASLVYFLSSTNPLTNRTHTNSYNESHLLTTTPSSPTGIERPDDPNPPDIGDDGKSLRDTAKLLTFKPLDVSYLRIYEIKESELPHLAIARSADGSVSCYHNDYKITFPEIKKSFIDDDSNIDPLASEYGKLGMYPNYVTDTRGNLLLMYEYEAIEGGSRTKFDLLENVKKDALLSNYYRIASSGTKQIKVDSSVKPVSVERLYWARVGVMQCDTIFTREGVYDRSKDPMVRMLVERMAAKDSLFKMQFGGEAGLETRFRFPVPGVRYNSRSYEAKLLAKTDSIDRVVKEPSARATAKITVIREFIENPNVPDTVKLRFEQFSRRFQYEQYLLEHKQDEAKLANLDNLVPVLVRKSSGNKLDSTYDNGLIFWYENSAAFNKALPSISAQMNVQNEGNGQLRTSVYPNPASKVVFIQYTLAKDAQLTIDLFDLLGKDVKRGFLSRNYSKGSHTESLDISGVAPGIYLLRITTGTGEQSIQRIAVEK